MISKCFLFHCLSPPWTPGLWSVGQPAPWEAEPWGLPQSHNQGGKLVCLPCRGSALFETLLWLEVELHSDFGKGKVWIPAVSISVWLWRVTQPFLASIFSPVKWRFYGLLFRLLRWASCSKPKGNWGKSWKILLRSTVSREYVVDHKGKAYIEENAYFCLVPFVQIKSS